MPRVLHIADLHLASPLGRLPENIARAIRDDGFALLERICRAANDADALVISGDLFDTPMVSKTVAARVSQILGTAAVPVFIVAGNHDYIHDKSPYMLTKFADNVHVFGTNSFQKYSLDTLDIYGISFDSDTVERPLLSGLCVDTSRRSVVVMHGELASASDKNPITIADIEQCSADYLALGHIHRRSEPKTAGRTIYAYCGSPMGRGFDETINPRGGYMVDIGDTTNVEFVPFGARRFHDIEVHLDAQSSAAQSVEKHLPVDCECDLIRVTLIGERTGGDFAVEQIENELRERCFYLTVRDSTRLPARIWQRAGDDTLAGHALSLAQERGGDDIELAARYLLAALDGGEEPI